MIFDFMNFQNRRFDFMDLMDQEVCFDTPPFLFPYRLFFELQIQ